MSGSQIAQVISNLVRNAVQAMQASEREQILWFRTKIQASTAIVFELEDTGTGIDPAQLENIFDAFVTTKEGGMALGLAICRAVVEHHGGQLRASSDGQSGALFQIILPYTYGG